MRIDRLSDQDRSILLAWFLHHLPMGERGPDSVPGTTNATRYELMRQFPAIYNKLADQEVVRVVTKAGERV